MQFSDSAVTQNTAKVDSTRLWIVNGDYFVLDFVNNFVWSHNHATPLTIVKDSSSLQ